MQNYFNYFTEIEERFSQRRGSMLMLSTLDWALIETWREAGIPLEAVLRGIDDAFDKFQLRAARAKGRLRKVNGLAWAAQSVLAAAEAAVDASTGAAIASGKSTIADGFEPGRIADYLQANAATLQRCGYPLIGEKLASLAEVARRDGVASLEDLDRTLSVLEQKLVATVVAATPDDVLAAVRTQASEELAAYRGKMKVEQIRQVEAQFLHKRLMAAKGLPRLSLFYMTHV